MNTVRKIVVVLSLVAFLAAGCGQRAVNSNSHSAAEPASAPVAEGHGAASNDVRLSIVDYDGIQEHVARNRGKVVVMDAWSTSCPPCMKEFHNLVELHHKYASDELACISLSFDYEGLGTPEEQSPRVLEFLRSQKATFDNLLSSEESDVLYRKFKLAAVPAVFVYDRQGKLRKRFDNEQAKSKEEAFTYQQVGQLVAELIKESPSEATPGN